LEGNILKVIDTEDDEEFKKYISELIEKDKESRRKRLDITRQVQSQNNELVKWKDENEKIQSELKESLANSENAMHEAQKLREEAEAARVAAEAAKIDAENSKEEALIAKSEAENAKIAAENDLDLAQKKSQFELIGTIVKVALIVILSVGLITTGMYLFAILSGKDTQVIGSTWSNIIGILLTNAFSIVGTIMGVKYASEKKE
jgi:multidrug efflux pump subunit AcrA (membrane-fusion protein)